MANFEAKNFTLIGDKLSAGMQAPDFELIDINCNIKSLKDYEGKIKVISCIPSIDTGVCDAQTKRFADTYGSNSNVQVLNVSVDLPFAFSRWCEANNKNIVCLSDYRNNNFGKSYGILMDPYMTLYRSVFVLDKNNKIVLALYNKEVGEPVDFAKVEEAVKSLL